jgi:sulfoxide reductase heme-binding subunit YedZ
MNLIIDKKKVTYLKFIVGFFFTLHILYLITGIFSGRLGSNPVEVLTHETGEWGLHLLLATLVVTPLRRHFRLNALIFIRRFLGLCSFAYIALHFLTYIVFDHFFDWRTIIDDIIGHPYIAVGALGFILMCPLAITSFKALQKRMGQSWVSLHRLIYFIAVCGIVHYWWLVKADYLQPIIYGSILAALFADRIYWFFKKRVANS